MLQSRKYELILILRKNDSLVAGGFSQAIKWTIFITELYAILHKRIFNQFSEGLSMDPLSENRSFIVIRDLKI